MPVNMVVRKGAYDGFIMPVVYGAILALPTWMWLFSQGEETVRFFLSGPALKAGGLLLLVIAGWLAVKLGKMVLRAWQLRDLPILDMDDAWMSYRAADESELHKVLYKDMARAHLRERGEESAILVIELVPVGFMGPALEPIEIDLSNTNAQPEDVCDAIVERIVRQSPRNRQGESRPSTLDW